RCQEVGASVIDAQLELPLADPMQVVDAYRRSHTPHTALWIASHITSPTAITLPVEQLAREATNLGVPLAIDGPHAPLQVPLSLRQLDCDFYLASCHKWLSAPLGSGF
ncbi:MAG: aminotransferase class V-fold PLP-dependent enzyme, partial [Pirellulaceae bacterium]